VALIRYALSMPFSPDDLVALAAAEEVDLETRLAPEAPEHRTTVWVVVDGSDVFVRSYRGPDARWYREAVANPQVAIHVDGRRLEGRAVHAPDESSVLRTSDGFKSKYPGDPGTLEMTTQYLDTTLRIDPA
jgi:hypothetical protein